MPNRVLKINDDVIVTSFLNESQQNFAFLFVIPSGAKFEQNQTRNKEVAKNRKWRHCDVFLKIVQQFLCVSIFLIPIDVPSFKLIEGQIKEL